MSEADDFLASVTRAPPKVAAPAAATPAPRSVLSLDPGTATPAAAVSPASREGTVKFWMDKGAPEHVAQGIADRVQAESGFTPGIMGDGGTSGGLYQHHAERLDRLKAFAAKQNKPWTDPMMAHEFASTEVQGGDAIAAKHWQDILAAPNRQTAAYLWDKYFERSKNGVNPWDQNITAKNGYRVSDKAVEAAEKAGKSVYYADPADVLGLLPATSGTASEERKRSSLRKSLFDRGEPLEDLPEVSGKAENGKFTITDYDGRKRLEEAIKAGVTSVPIAFPKGDVPKEIVGLTGVTVPFEFRPIPQRPPLEPTRAERFGTGVRDMVGGATQLASHLIPTGVEEGINRFNNTLADAGVPLARVPERNLSGLVTGQTGGIDQMERDRIKNIEAERTGRGETGTDWWRVAGNIAGTAPAMAIPGVGSGFTGALMTGAIQGAVGAAAAPVTSEGGYWSSKLGQVAEGAALGGAIGGGVNQIAKYIAPVAQAGVSKIENTARQAISQRFADRAAGSGAVPSEVADTMAFARSQGQPMTLADVPELAGMAGTVSRSPGEAGARMKTFFSERRAGAMQRLDNILSRYLPTGSVKRTVEELANERAKAAAPLYREAFEGGSLAPLEKQFAKEWNSAAAVAKNAEQNVARIENELNTALAKKTTAGNVYSSSAASRATKFAQDKIKDQRKIAEEARTAEQSALARLRRAQEDGTANAPGAVWSPTIQRLVSNPRVQVGIRKGMKIERDLADAEGRPFNMREYAIVGTDDAGEPIVGAVPTMRLLAAAKKGLDAMVGTMRSDKPPWRLTEEGKAVDALRRSLLDELYMLNPKYKTANEAWSGGQESINATVAGQRALHPGVSVEDVADEMARLTERDRDFFRLGVADQAKKDLLNAPVGADKSKRVINTEAERQKFATIMGGDENAERFIRAIENERTMFDSERSIIGGSQTQERGVEDAGVNGVMAMLHAGRAVTEAAHGHVISSIASALRSVREVRNRGNQMLRNPALANEVSRLLTNPNLGMNAAGAGRGAPPMLPSLPVAQEGAGPARNMLAGAIGAGGQALAPGAGAAVASGP